MRTTIDAAGRIVVPKPVRDDLGLAAGTELELSVVDGHIEIDVPATPMRLEETEHGVVAVADREMPTLTTELVRDTLERVRR
ncbi:MAG: AbrB/MazE/SpoVT family DNA-binding domain-containing protein [Solirubrobacteraceae bacterium MAG38_C4-C5]|nr:AbrB/MazE/SpoVT family DNA-binding domain-containing protein [Candidatus Siliceabacter maunaloa]